MATRTEFSGAIEDALRAPSIHNTQPWRWRIRPDAAELHADWDRHLMVTDPECRDLVLSCGAALHHLQVALAARGLAHEVERVPEPDDRGHLATVRLRSGRPGPEPGPASAALFPGIPQRRTDRRRMSTRPVPQEMLRSLVEQAHGMDSAVLPVSDPAMRERLVAVIADAGRQQYATPGYATELRMWTHRLPGGHDGIPTSNVAASTTSIAAPSPLRRFPRGGMAQPPHLLCHGMADDASELMLVATPGDDIVDRVRAGEATSALLLAATCIGLATTPLSQGLEVESSRHHLQRDVLGIPEHPQIVIRVGWPAAGAVPLPMTPRRALRSVLMPD